MAITFLLYLLIAAVFVVIGIVRTTEFRTTAREKLSGKWGKSVLIILAYLAIMILLSIVSGLFTGTKLEVLISIAISILDIPLTYGFTASFLKLYNGEEVKAFDFLSSSFSNFGRSWAIQLRIILKLLLPVLVFILAIGLTVGNLIYVSSTPSTNSFGVSIIATILYIVSIIWLIIRSYSYEMAMYIAIDSPELTTKEAVEQSRKIMKGNRAKLFWLQLSFGGWMLLAMFTLGIGLLWLASYMQFAIISFYYFVAKKDDNVVVEVIQNNPTETLE